MAATRKSATRRARSAQRTTAPTESPTLEQAPAEPEEVPANLADPDAQAALDGAQAPGAVPDTPTRDPGPDAAPGGSFDPALPIDAVIVASNVRRHFDEEALAELAEDVKVNGILQPLLVRVGEDVPDGRVVLVAGERRLRAARLAGLATVPVLIRRMDARTAARVQLLENVHRADLNPIEEAEGYAALLRDHGYTQTQLAAELGVSQPHIANRMRLMKLPEGARDSISRGILPAATALPLVKIAEQYPEVADRAARDMVTAKVVAARAEEWVSDWLGNHMTRLEGWDAHCCGDHQNCPCRRLATQFGRKVAVCMDPARFAQVEEEARQAIIAQAARERPRTVAPEPARAPDPQDDDAPATEAPQTPAADAPPEAPEDVPPTETDEPQADALPVAEEPAGPEVLDLRLLPGHTYTYLGSVRSADDAPTECRDCPCLRLGQRGPDGTLDWVCTDPPRHQAEERRRTRERNRQAAAALSTERERSAHWAVSRVQETWLVEREAPRLGAVDLAYLTAFILTAAKPEYGINGKSRANLREYLAGHGVEIDNAAAPYHTHAEIAEKLMALPPQTLWRLCIEWPLLAAAHGLGQWYQRRVDHPEGVTCDLCGEASHEVATFHCRRADAVPAGVSVQVCPTCRSASSLSLIGFYPDANGSDPVQATPEQVAAIRAALDARGTDAGALRMCHLCGDDFREHELRRFFNHGWDGAPKGAWMDVCPNCAVDGEAEDGGLYGFRLEPPQPLGPQEALSDEQVAQLLAQEADGEIGEHMHTAAVADSA